MVERLLTYLIRLMAPFIGDMAISYRPFRGSGNRPAVSGRGQWWSARTSLLGLGLLFLISAAPAQALPAAHGTTINNQADLTYSGGSATAEVDFQVSIRTVAELDFFQYAPGSPDLELISVAATEYRDGANTNDPFDTIDLPKLLDGTVIDLTQPVPLLENGLYHQGEPLFMRLVDFDQNLDPNQAETILVSLVAGQTGDQEVLRFTETGLNTGIFTGYIQSSSDSTELFNGVLSVAQNYDVQAFYTDIFDKTDTAVSAALFDPYGVVFNSQTGEPVEGVTVTLYDGAGNLATVYGDDGFSIFPAEIVTGESVEDASGRRYDFEGGYFRFPFVAVGEYQLVVTPPAQYNAPSIVSITELQQLPGAPFALGDSSFGEVFALNPGPALRIDIPIDPLASALWLRKEVNKDITAIGEFLQYTLTVDNSSSPMATGEIRIDDRLPLGFRYQKGSLKIGGAQATDPTLSSDGRSMEIIADSTPAGETLTISYVVEVSSGARLGEAVNHAVATDAYGNRSNTAKASVLVRDDFMRNTTFLVGRVMIGGCSEPDTTKEGLANVRIYLEDGSYVDTDQTGKYHFEGVEPGVHVVQVDTLSLPHDYEMLPCEQSSQAAGSSFSKFVDLQGGSLWRVDFYAAPKKKPSGEVALTLSAELDKKTAEFTATVSSRAIPADNLRLAMMLPGGFNYLSGTARQDDQTVITPQSSNGNLTFNIDQLAIDQTTRISFRAQLEGSPASGELPAKAVLSFDTSTAQNQQTPPAETRFQMTAGEPGQSHEIKLYPNFPSCVAKLQQTDVVMLEQLVMQLKGQKVVRLDIVGHTDNQNVALRSRHLFANNQVLSLARAQSVAAFLKERLTLPEDSTSVRGMGETMPVADNASDQGRALNRRVELYLVTETTGRQPLLAVSIPTSSKQSVTIGEPENQSNTAAATEASTEEAPATPQELPIGLLSPSEDHAVSRIEAVRVRLDTKLKPRLTLDGTVIPENRIGFRMTEPETGTTLYSYIGVDFGEPGRHKLLIEGLGPFGNSRFTQEAQLLRTGDIGSIRLLKSDGNIADGRTPVRLQLEIRDTLGALIESSLMLSIRDGELKPLGYKTNELASLNRKVEVAQKFVTVDRDGFAEFHPVNTSGLYRTVIGYNETEIELETYVKPELRDWVLVGFAEGTAGYSTFSGNQVSLEEAGIDEHFYHDGEVKFFAKGAIKGEWLLTMAYDSDKPNLDGDSLHQIIDPDSYYPLYGDGSSQGYDASSARDIYLKLEHDQFYVMFGDMNTAMNQTELARYNRSMNGIKSEMQTANFSYTVYAADTKQSFEKEEIPGDGTSGRYYLSAGKLVINSEQVTIETRDRFHSERVIESRSLSRHTDYDIDFDDGSLFFKEPVPSKDDEFNPIFIVVRYETVASEEENFNYGGRAAVKLLDQKVEVGASYIHEDRGIEKGDLYGADATIKLTQKTTLLLEAATTDTKAETSDASGDAYLAELKHEGNRVKGLAYYREQKGAFGLGQQNDSETGTRKYGVEGSYQINPQVSASGLFYHEDVLSSGAERDVVELDSRYQADRYSLRAGVREARDLLGDGEKQRSTQGLLGADWVTSNRKLKLRADYEQSLGTKNKNTDYPTLLTLGADYKLTKQISVFADQEFSWGDDENTESSRFGFNATPWKGGNMSTTVERQLNENGQRVYAIFGLGQSWQVNENWSVDGSLDRSYTVKAPAYSFNDNVPAAHGSDDDFTALSLGATYSKDNWTWWNRVESRHAESEDKFGISTSVVGEPRSGVAVSAKALAFMTDTVGGTRRTDGNIRFGLAYRPNASRWVTLDRLDFYFDREQNSPSGYNNWRVVNNLHSNYKLSNKAQTSFYYGLKYVRENISGTRYDGFTDLIASETRYNINKNWDVGVHGSMLHSWNSQNLDYSTGASVGYSPMTNAWISVGYNLVGFEDEDFDSAHYTAQGAYIRFRIKFDQQSVREAAEWLNR